MLSQRPGSEEALLRARWSHSTYGVHQNKIPRTKVETEATMLMTSKNPAWSRKWESSDIQVLQSYQVFSSFTFYDIRILKNKSNHNKCFRIVSCLGFVKYIHINSLIPCSVMAALLITSPLPNGNRGRYPVHGRKLDQSLKELIPMLGEAQIAACNGDFYWSGWITSVFMKFSDNQTRSNYSFSSHSQHNDHTFISHLFSSECRFG